MVDIENMLSHLLSGRTRGPFLFVGSGLSRRYLGLETWESLLKLFCEDIQPYAFYKGLAGGDLAETAWRMCSDFYKIWWSSPKYIASREAFQDKINSEADVLKYEICLFLKNNGKLSPDYNDEIELLSRGNIDGIVTTNWDDFLETIFKEFKLFVGQEGLLVNETFAVAEIYKIQFSPKHLF